MIRSIAIAATLLASTLPAIASAEPVGEDARRNPAATATVAKAAAANPKVRYCVDLATTGSLLTRRICRTRADWLSHGTDPVEFLKR